MSKKLISVLLLLACFALASTAQARHFKVYGYKTPEAGESELVYWNDYVAQSAKSMAFFGKNVDREGLLIHTLEVEYGLTDRLKLAAYLDAEQPSGENIELVRARVVAAHYRFGNAGERFFDPAIYIEYYLPRPAYLGYAKERVEARIILEKKLGDMVLKLNPVLEKVVSGPKVDEGMELAYSASLYGPLSDKLQWGIEYYGGVGELVAVKPVDEQKNYLVPAVTYKFNKHFKWNIGAAFGISKAADDLVIKNIIAWEL